MLHVTPSFLIENTHDSPFTGKFDIVLQRMCCGDGDALTVTADCVVLEETVEDCVGDALEEGTEETVEDCEADALEEGLDVDKADGLVVALGVADGVGGIIDAISLPVNSRLYTRRSDIEPEKSSPAVLTGDIPFQPRRRVDKVEEVEIANDTDVEEATLAPSI